MSKHKEKEKIQRLISQSRPHDAIRGLFAYIEEVEKHTFKGRLILIKGRLKSLEKINEKGVVTQPDYLIEINRIQGSLLQIVDDLFLTTTENHNPRHNTIEDKTQKNHKIVPVDASQIKTARHKLRQRNDEEIGRLFRIVETNSSKEINTNKENIGLLKKIKVLKRQNASLELEKKHLEECVIKVNGKEFKILNHINDGTSGGVWRAKQIQGNPQIICAIKFQHERHYNDPLQHSRFELGAKFQGELQGKNIVKVVEGPYDDTEAGVRFYIMEFVEGKNLKQSIGGSSESVHRMQPKIIRSIFSRICSALEIIHNKNFEDSSLNVLQAHGDICPSNILIDKNNNAYLTDFDSIHRSGRKWRGKYQNILGTTPYSDKIPEERIESDDIFLKRLQQADIYALTLCIIFCFRGQSLKDEELNSTVNANGWKTIIKGLPCSLQLQSFLENAIEGEFQQVSDFNNALASIDTFDPPPPQKPPGWLRRNKNKILGSGIFCLFLLFLAVLSGNSYLLHKDREQHYEWLMTDSIPLKPDSASSKALSKFWKLASDTNSTFNIEMEKLLDALVYDSISNPSDRILNYHDFTEIANHQDLETFTGTYDKKIKKGESTEDVSAKHYWEYALWTPNNTDSATSDTTMCELLQSDVSYSQASRYFYSITDSLINKQHRLREKKPNYETNDQTSFGNFMGEMIGIDKSVSNTIRPLLIFAGYQQNSTDSVFTFRYPAFDIAKQSDKNKWGGYNPTDRYWWNVANSENKGVLREYFRYEIGGKYKCGLCMPYPGIGQGIPPTRSIWCKKRIENADGDISTIVLAVDFIFYPLLPEEKLKRYLHLNTLDMP